MLYYASDFHNTGDAIKHSPMNPFSPKTDSADLGSLRAELLAMLVQKSFRQSVEPAFKLASGQMSRYYVDSKQTVLTARGAYLAGRLLFERIAPLGPDAAGGLTLGADPLAVAVAVLSAQAGRPIAAFIVRKEPKGHGTGSWIEGGLSPQSLVVILEDVVTTGASTLKAIERVRAHGCRILKAVCLIDRAEGGRDAITQAGVELDAVFTLQDLLSESNA